MDIECSELKLLTPVEPLTPRNKSPVQQWVDSLPTDEPVRRDEEPSVQEAEGHDVEVESFTLGAEAAGLVFPRPYPSVHISNACGGSDAGSHCSSMESLLEARKPDPEELLLELGFGGCEEPDSLSRIPARFLQPSTLKGVAIDDFIKHQKLLVHTFQSGFSGYRGLTGPSHAMPSMIVGKIMERLREAEVGRCTGEVPLPGSSPRLAKIANNIINKIKTAQEVSVLSPDNRKWYQNQGDKSPEPSNRRLIIGHQSYTFSKDGNLIESPTSAPRTENSSPHMSQTESAKDLHHNECSGGFRQDVSEMEEEEIEWNAEVDREVNGIISRSTSSSEPAAGEINKVSKEVKSDIKECKEQDLLSKQLVQDYKNMALLVAQLSGSDAIIDIGSEENFCKLGPEERKCLVINLIESALSTYQQRLRELDLRSHLRDLLSGQVHKVNDLLDVGRTQSLNTLIKQMTSLLRHQESLRKELQLHEAQSSSGYKESFS